MIYVKGNRGEETGRTEASEAGRNAKREKRNEYMRQNPS